MKKDYKIAVAGTGYVGLSIATLLSQHHQVTAVDIIPEKVDMINNRKSPIQDDYIEKYLAEKELNLTATLDAKAAYSDADFVVIAAPTNYDSHTQHFATSAVEMCIRDRCSIGSIYGAPADCIWGGGRTGFGGNDPREVLALMQEYGVSARLTFSNSLLREEHLSDRKCNALCALFAQSGGVENGVILHSELLLDYLRTHYPQLYLVSSTTKVLTDFRQLRDETAREEFRYVVPDFRLNKAFEQLDSLTQPQKDKVEFLCNECCWVGCRDRKRCYENVSRKNLGENCPDHICTAPGAGEGYRFSKAMENPSFIGVEDIRRTFLPMGFSNFKIEGRGLGSALVLEFLLYYMVRPEYQLHVREAIYLDSMLDLF